MPLAAPMRSTRQAALDPDRTPMEARALKAVARTGLSGPSRAFPHAARIQAAFGAHAPQGLRAHMGPAARAAGAGLSASGYAFGGKVAFAEQPDLHTAAHEAAHATFQARGLATAAHGVGVHTDASERQADRVADAVVAGRSAEPLLAAFPGSPGSTSVPVLQMKNKITDNGGVATDTPWKEISDQLPLDSNFDMDAHISQVLPGFATMIKQLGDNSLRASHVTAKVQGKAPSHDRPADALQTAYGTIGTFEEYITGSPSLPNYEFNGGHLISDKILQDDSSVEGNLAPQRRYLNSPIFRKIEEIGEGGIRYVGDPSAKPLKPPPHSMTTRVKYPSDTHDVPSDDVILRLKIPPKALTATPPSGLTLSTWVPTQWKTTVTAPPSYVFSHQSRVDSDDSSWAGYLGDLARVKKKRPKATTYIDRNYWALDTLTVKDPLSKTGDGRLTAPSGTHTFLAVQSAPRSGSTAKNKASKTIAPPVPKTIPVVDTDMTLDDIVESNVSDLTKRAREFKSQKSVNPKKRVKLDVGQGDLEDSFRTIKTAFLELGNPFAVTELSKFEGRSVKSGRNKSRKKRTKLGEAHQIVSRSVKPGKKYSFL